MLRFVRPREFTEFRKEHSMPILYGNQFTQNGVFKLYCIQFD